jgi:2-polyprenyl-3-methyl-5-hydroxy-6-metoxy-1,4-benzoquinol methylase
MGKAILNLFRAIFKPRKWRLLYSQSLMVFKHVIKFRDFAFNLNTKKYWNMNFSEMGDSWRDAHYRNLTDVFLPDGEFTLLDVGCALGDGCRLFKRMFPGAKITGVDFSEVAIEKAREMSNDIDYLLVDLLKDPVPGEYDYITIVETLEHFDDPFYVLDKCLKHVRKSIIVSVPYSKVSKKLVGIDYHKYSFNEFTFKKYHCKILKIAGLDGSLDENDDEKRVIVYEIKP